MPDSLSGIIFNEILPQPNAGGGTGFDTDGSGSVSALDEYVELFNSSAVAVDISGWELWDPGTGNWFTFPAGSILEPGAYALVVVGVQAGGSLPALGPDDLAFNTGRSSALINNAGDNAYLVDTGSNTFITAAFGNWPVIDPTDPADWANAPSSTAALPGFPAGATQVGAGEYFGPITRGSSLARTPDGSTGFDPAATPTPGTPNICFVAGTRLATPRGNVAIEHLRPGDLLLTSEGAATRIQWIGSRALEPGPLARSPDDWPIRIAPGALGPGRPARALRVSPQHRVLLSGAEVQALHGCDAVLVPARALLGLRGISCRAPHGGVTYLHVLCDRHSVLMAEGAAAESLYLGPMARRSLARAALREIFARAPALQGNLLPDPARPLLNMRQARRLVACLQRTGALPQPEAACPPHASPALVPPGPAHAIDAPRAAA